MNIGDRVGALLSRDAKTAYLFGYGIYEGDFEVFNITEEEMNQAVKALLEDDNSMTKEEAIEFIKKIRLNPRIKLDSGQTVWGCECWWGPEDQIKKDLEAFTIVNVNIDQERAKNEN